MDNIVPQIVGHVPREISRPVNYFLKYGGEVFGKVADEHYRPSPIPKGGLEITLTVICKIAANKQEIIQRLDSLIKDNYDESFLEGLEPGDSREGYGLENARFLGAKILHTINFI